MKTALVLVAVVSAVFAQASSVQTVECFDHSNSDLQITLTLDASSGSVLKAHFSNQDHGLFDDRDLSPSEYSFDARDLTLSFQGDDYGCEPVDGR